MYGTEILLSFQIFTRNIKKIKNDVINFASQRNPKPTFGAQHLKACFFMKIEEERDK